MTVFSQNEESEISLEPSLNPLEKAATFFFLMSSGCHQLCLSFKY